MGQEVGKIKKRLGAAVLILVVGVVVLVIGNALLKERGAGVDDFIDLLDRDRAVVSAALNTIEANWHSGNAVMLVECLPLLQDTYDYQRVLNLLQQKTGRPFRFLDDWYDWIWQQEYKPHPDYADFKARLYEREDPHFPEYFAETASATIRLDEILWGGVVRDGIPPLKDPKMLSAADATYLDESNVVFGLEINGDARAYPKRILAWHEMFKDTVGGESLCGVYCTLCGSMIVYRTEFQGRHFELGTSGFLYRSNKLMYDHRTKSLWSTMAGEPVVGPLAGKTIKLERRDVVTTTWGEWRRRHPDTKVLSPDTGYRRDYGEGVAYADYFATDALMFFVPLLDSRLKNKDEVLALRFDQFPDEQLAISAKFLDQHPVYHDRLGNQDFVVITDPSGANRVYETGGRRFKSWDGKMTVVDEENQQWTLSESDLTGPSGRKLGRLPAHRAFWFGWHAAYPETRLVD
ncbi:MAG: DUF3179 domain-containing protein [Planctomycetes bacterium]|nr:DUF3179 domain-containing protein [Planctomycetota bacterium]